MFRFSEVQQAARDGVLVRIVAKQRNEARERQPEEAFVLPERVVGIEADGGEGHRPLPDRFKPRAA